MENSSAERHRDLDRFLTFIDAVVAIAITLLVLPLVELTGEITGDEPVSHVLDEHQAQIWAFFLSFVVISRLWFIQHSSVRHVLLYQSRVANLTLLWALTIVVLPFPTALVATAGEDPLSKILYIGTIAVGVLALALADLVVQRHPEITDGEGMPDALDAGVNVALLLVALTLTLAVPPLGYYPMLLLLLDTSVLRVVTRLRG